MESMDTVMYLTAYYGKGKLVDENEDVPMEEVNSYYLQTLTNFTTYKEYENDREKEEERKKKVEKDLQDQIKGIQDKVDHQRDVKVKGKYTKYTIEQKVLFLYYLKIKLVKTVIASRRADMEYLSNCVFVNESGFSINLSPPAIWTKVVGEEPYLEGNGSSNSKIHSVIGAIFPGGVLQMELRTTQEESQLVKILKQDDIYYIQGSIKI
ncbi:uncharacterized protein BX663DRAFT_544930 [Cokeromyces recurvatus]|uniref:uncharacterized protein n=1 Tax=Cokeromyces recurvatus TaxID=90255 RepID=UPI002220A2D6|nr:uncharacterized protein BX663DRAFT_544930 [Cokeromyces recurvatus]KAI7900485.1 hypothetical protein BX663DRAFT_544930 [Cokeromyces recurvatus]